MLPWYIGGVCATNSHGVHHLEEQQLRCGGRRWCATLGPCAIDHEGVLGCQREQDALRDQIDQLARQLLALP